MNSVMVMKMSNKSIPQKLEYFSKYTLKRANNRAIRLKLNRSVVPKFIDSLEYEKFPVIFKLFKDSYGGTMDIVRYVVQMSPDLNDHLQIDVPVKYIGKDVLKMMYLPKGDF